MASASEYAELNGSRTRWLMIFEPPRSARSADRGGVLYMIPNELFSEF
jgi:hypothetical protein